jgi:glycosyltransferase involved in cell wall biosynthesis
MLGIMDSLPGVVNHDRIGQEELADLQLSCEAWLYPHQPNYESGYGGWLETYAITAQEAEAARCKIISRKNGALPETIKHAIWWDADTNIVETLKNLDTLWDPRWTEKNYQWAINRTWEGVAREWAQELSDKESREETLIGDQHGLLATKA